MMKHGFANLKKAAPLLYSEISATALNMYSTKYLIKFSLQLNTALRTAQWRGLIE
jgi:hypothetical protein